MVRLLIFLIYRIVVLFSSLFLAFEISSRRVRRQYAGYNYAQQYGNQYGIYGPGGQGWPNRYNDRYPNQQQGYAWNNNFNWNQGNRRPEWYYNNSSINRPLSFICLCLVQYIFYFIF